MHFPVFNRKVGMDIGDASVQHVFYKGAVAAIDTFTDDQHFTAHGNVFSHLFIGVFEDTGPRCF